MVNRKFLYLLLVAGIVAGGIFAARSWMNNRTRSSTASSEHIVFTVQRGDITQTVTGSAPIEAFERQEVTSALDGTVFYIAVNEGDFVEKGALLLQLYNDDIRVAVEKAQLDFLLAEMEYEEMLNPDIEESEELDIESARLKVEEAELALEGKLSQRAKLEVKTPVSGQVDFAVSTGDEVFSGSLLATVYSKDLLVKLQVSELRVSEAQVGQEVRIYVPAVGRSYDGVVTEISREGTVSQSSSDVSGLSYFTVTIKADFDEKVKAGMSATVSNVYENVEGAEEETVIITLGRGNTFYAQTEEIRAEVGGKVIKMSVEDGMPVWEGMPLLWLENSDLDYQIRQAQVGLAQAKNNLEKLLNPEGKTYTYIDLEKQRIKVEQARLNLQSQLEKLNSLKVTSEVSGRVMEIAVGVGSNVTTKDLLLTIADYSRMKLVLSIDELDISKIVPGQDAVITVDALPGRKYRGRVLSIATEGTVSGDITSYDVTLEILEPEGIMAGMRATATIVTNEVQNVLVLPTEAVTFETGALRGIVEVLVDGKIERRPVEIGLVGTRYLEIKSGVAEGEQVVITGAISSTMERARQMMPGGMMPGIPGGNAPGGTGGMRPQPGGGDTGRRTR